MPMMKTLTSYALVPVQDLILSPSPVERHGAVPDLHSQERHGRFWYKGDEVNYIYSPNGKKVIDRRYLGQIDIQV